MRNQCTRNRVVSTLAIVTGLGALPLFSGCMTLEQMVPPVGEDFLVVAAQRGMEQTTLELGREIYLSDCVKCHSVEPIGRYSADHWREILPRMSREAELDDQRSAAVDAYVTLARALLEKRARTEGEIATGRERVSRENVLDPYAASGSR